MSQHSPTKAKMNSIVDENRLCRLSGQTIVSGMGRDLVQNSRSKSLYPTNDQDWIRKTKLFKKKRGSNITDDYLFSKQRNLKLLVYMVSNNEMICEWWRTSRIREGTAQINLNLGTRCRLVSILTLRSLYPQGKNTGTERTGRCVGPTAGLNVFTLAENRTPNRVALQPKSL